MYDFYLGEAEDIQQDESKYLLAVKRMLPRWINSLPDSEFLALAKLLDEQGTAVRAQNRRLVTVETGVGASTLAFVFYAMKYGGIALSWDPNSEKGSAIRTACNETLSENFKKSTTEHWKLIAVSSLCPYVGLGAVLPELVGQIDFFFHDSEHVWGTVGGELEAIMPLLNEGAVVALDDANQIFSHTNTAYTNIVRRKLGLSLLENPTDNVVDPFFVKAEALLREHWQTVDYLPDIYKENFRTDSYFSYYNAEFDINTELETLRADNLEHRFDSWRVSGSLG